MNLKNICIVSEFYPYEGEPLFPFVQQLTYSMSNEGVKCSVVAPQSITKIVMRRCKRKPFHIVDKSPEGHIIDVYRPYYITFSNTKNVLLKKISHYIMCSAIKRGFRKSGNVDAVYSYFWHVGLNTAKALKNENVPIYVQASECEITVECDQVTEDNLKKISGVICASGKNKKESIREGLLGDKRSTIVVNGYRTDEFYKTDKYLARKKMNMPEDKFIVAFVGGFIKRKGLPQLCEALNRFDDVYSIFIGKGEEHITCGNVLFSGTVEHNKIVDYLNCADIFVLPTEAEGCCNAIIEALACGLPVVSSDKDFNDEILDENCSIRIDEHSTDEIFNAIKVLKNDRNMLSEMSVAALRKSEELTIENRAKKIKNFISGVR